MKIKINPNEIKRFLALSSTISSSSKEPSNNFILIQTNKEVVKFSVYDGKTYYSFVINTLEGKEEGSCCINTKKFFELISTCNQDININGTDEKAIITIGRSKYTISGTNPKNFPSTIRVPEGEGLVMQKHTLREMLRYSFCFDKEGLNPVFASISLGFKDGFVRAISTNGLKFSYVDYPSQNYDNLLIPFKAVPLINKFIDDEPTELKLKKDGNHLFIIKPNNQALGINLITLPFPDTTKVWIKEEEITYKYKLTKDLLTGPLARLLKSSDQKSTEICFVVSGNELNISANNRISDGLEVLDIENVLGTDLEISMSGLNLLQFIQAFEEFFLIVPEKKNKIEIRNLEGTLGYLLVPMVKITKEVEKKED